MSRVTLVPKKIIENLFIVGLFYFIVSYSFFYLSLIGISNNVLSLLVVVSSIIFLLCILKSFKNVIFLEKDKILIKNNKEKYIINLSDINRVDIGILDTRSVYYQFFLNNGNSINYVLDNSNYSEDTNNKFLNYLNEVNLLK